MKSREADAKRFGRWRSIQPHIAWCECQRQYTLCNSVQLADNRMVQVLNYLLARNINSPFDRKINKKEWNSRRLHIIVCCFVRSDQKQWHVDIGLYGEQFLRKCSTLELLSLTYISLLFIGNVHSPTFHRTAMNIALQLELQEGAIWLMLSATAVIVSHDIFGRTKQG